MEQKWNIESLKEYLEKILAEKDKAIKTALDSAKEAVLVAEKNSQKWRDAANEWRGAMTDRERNFVQQSEFNAYKEATEKQLSIERSRADKGDGRAMGMNQVIAWIIGGATVIGVLFNILLKYLQTKT